MSALAEISFDSAIASLREKAASFANTYRQFSSLEYIAQKDPALYSEWKTAKTRAEYVINTVSWINRQVDAAASWLGNMFNLNGVQGIGAIPLIPVAYVVAAISAMTFAGNAMLSTMGRIYEFKRRMDLVDSGQAGTDILETPDTSISGQIGTALKWVIIGAAVYYVAPRLIERFKK